MDTTQRNVRDAPDETEQNVLVIGGNHFGLAVAESLIENAQSVTFVSEDQPRDVVDGVKTVNRELSDAIDVRALTTEITDVDLVVVVGSDSETLLLGHLVGLELDPRDVVATISNPANEPAFEGTGVDCIDLSQLLAEQIRDQYK